MCGTFRNCFYSRLVLKEILSHQKETIESIVSAKGSTEEVTVSFPSFETYAAGPDHEAPAGLQRERTRRGAVRQRVAVPPT